MRGFFVCGLLLLALSSVYAITLDTSTTDSSTRATVTSPIGTAGVSDRSSTMQGSDTLATTVTTTGTSGNPGTKPSTTSGTTQSPGPSQSTVTEQTLDSTPSGNSVTATIGTTGNPASTTATTTTLLPVTVKKAQVTMTCNDGRCKYLLVVPRLNQTFLDSQQESLDKDQALFATEEAKYEDLTQTGDVKDIETQFKAINASVYVAIAQYNRIQAALKQIPIDSLYTNSSATKIQSFITTLTNQANTCLYDTCLKPVPTTTTTTTTAPPTTTPNPCQPDSCNCQADCKPANGKASCNPCNGNLDNGQMCVTSTCTPVGTSKAQNVNDYAWLVSPDFDIKTGNSTKGYGSNLACEWTLQVSGQGVTYLALSPSSSDPPFSQMDSTGKLIMKCGGFSYTIATKSTASKINGALRACTVPTLTFTFTSGTVPNDTKPYFGVQLITQPQDTTPKPPINACSSTSPSTTTSTP